MGFRLSLQIPLCLPHVERGHLSPGLETEKVVNTGHEAVIAWEKKDDDEKSVTFVEFRRT